MRKRFLVLASGSAMLLAALASSASAATMVTAQADCSGALKYHRSYTVSVESLPAGVSLPFSRTETFQTARGTVTCSLVIN